MLGDWRISPKVNRISKDDQITGIKHKSMAVLAFLADAQGEVRTRNEIMDNVWPGMTVTDDVLTQSIVEIRRAFDDDAKRPRIIETIPKVGFRLIAAITPVDEETSPALLRSYSSKPPRRYLRFALAFVAIAAIVWAFSEWRNDERKPVIVVHESPSIAVLPFVNISDDPDNVFFAEGMSEEIRNLLTLVPDLKVIGRTSSHAFKGKNEDLRVIGQKLGVSTVLEGSVRKSGNRVRISVQLTDTADGAMLWSDSYERMLTDIFAVQDEVAAAIIDALQIHVSATPTRGRPTESPEAYTRYLRAKAAINVFDPLKAVSELLVVVDLDPDFAEAYEMLAFSYWNLAGWAIDAVEAQKLVHEAANRAIDIDPNAVLAQALFRASSFGPYVRWRKMEAFEWAVRQQPDNPLILEPYVLALTEYGYLEEALRMAERYVELDPLSLIANTYWSASLYAIGRTEDAIAALEYVGRSTIESNASTWTIDGIYLAESQDEAAIRRFESYMNHDDDPDSNWIRELVTAARDTASGQTYLDRVIPQIVKSMPENDALDWQDRLTSFYLYFGFLDRYFEIILASKPIATTWHTAGIHIWRGHIYRRSGFTAHPKYLELVELLGILEIWEQRGPPDFCEKIDDDWVCE